MAESFIHICFIKRYSSKKSLRNIPYIYQVKYQKEWNASKLLHEKLIIPWKEDHQQMLNRRYLSKCCFNKWKMWTLFPFVRNSKLTLKSIKIRYIVQWIWVSFNIVLCDKRVKHRENMRFCKPRFHTNANCLLGRGWIG